MNICSPLEIFTDTNFIFGVSYHKEQLEDGEYSAHLHDYIEIEYVEDGEIEAEINGIKKHLYSGDFLGLKPGQSQAFKINKPSVIHSVHLSAQQVLPPIKDIIFSKVYPFTGTIPQNQRKIMADIFETVESQLYKKSGEYRFQRITAELLRCLCNILENAAPLAENSVIDDYIIKAIEYIQANYTGSITLTSVAEEINISPSYLSRLFSAETGYSFLEYVNMVRVNAAASQLLTTSKTVVQISADCGFGSFPSFARLFRQYTGQSATLYKKTYKK